MASAGVAAVFAGVTYFNELSEALCRAGLACRAGEGERPPPDPVDPPAPSASEASPCVAPAGLDPSLSAPAYWVRNSFAAFNDADYAGAIANVNACLRNWEPAALRDQAARDAQGAPAPVVGAIDVPTMQGILATDPLVHDVGVSLWMLGRAHQELQQTEDARSAFTQCARLTRARVWNPSGTLWAPAKDCEDQLMALPAN